MNIELFAFKRLICGKNYQKISFEFNPQILISIYVCDAQTSKCLSTVLSESQYGQPKNLVNLGNHNLFYKPKNELSMIFDSDDIYYDLKEIKEAISYASHFTDYEHILSPVDRHKKNVWEYNSLETRKVSLEIGIIGGSKIVLIDNPFLEMTYYEAFQLSEHLKSSVFLNIVNISANKPNNDLFLCFDKIFVQKYQNNLFKIL